MQLVQTPREALLKPLSTVAGIVERRHTLPILANILLRTEAGRVSVIATDLDVGPENESLTVAARKLVDILRALPDTGDVRLSTVSGKLAVQSGKSRFSLQTLAATEFPTMTQPDRWDVSLTLPRKTLKHLFNMVHFAMAQQDIRYYLNGMLLSIQGTRLTVASTDGHRLAVDATDLVETAKQDVDVILPRKTVLELGKLLGDDDEPVDIQINQNQVVFRRPNFELRSKVVDGKFPDWQRVIPVGHDKVFIIARQRLAQSLTRAAILTNEKYRGARLALTAGTLRIACSNNEQEEAQEELDIDYNGEPLDIGFNVQYLQDVLNNLGNDAVQCSFGDPTSSMLIMIPGDENFRYVVMPMRI